MSLRRDEYGFLRSNGYGHARGPDLRAELGAMPDDQVYRSSVRGGVRTSAPIEGEDVSYHPGDTFAVGPKVTKASARRCCSRSGGRAAGRLRSDRAAGGDELGIRDQALRVRPARRRAGERAILLPKDYPVTPPIGFYIHERGTRPR